MAVLIMVFRKMINKKWMTLCLLIGFILAVAMVSSIPIYTDGVLQRMLTRDLENHQVSTGFFPDGISQRQISTQTTMGIPGSRPLIF